VAETGPHTLKDRVVLVTGASRGIGREIAIRAAADRASLALLAKTGSVVNNPGALDLRSTPALPPKNFRRLLETNVDGPFAVVQAALPHLRQSDNWPPRSATSSRTSIYLSSTPLPST